MAADLPKVVILSHPRVGRDVQATSNVLNEQFDAASTASMYTTTEVRKSFSIFLNRSRRAVGRRSGEAQTQKSRLHSRNPRWEFGGLLWPLAKVQGGFLAWSSALST